MTGDPTSSAAPRNASAPSPQAIGVAEDLIPPVYGFDPPVYFLVFSRTGGETPMVAHDPVIAEITGKNASRRGIVYALRLDNRPDAANWLNKPVSELYRVYCRLRAAGKLPKPPPPPAPKKNPPVNTGSDAA